MTHGVGMSKQTDDKLPLDVILQGDCLAQLRALPMPVLIWCLPTRLIICN